MKRDSEIAEKMSDSLRVSVGLPIGKDGEYFVGSPDNYGQNKDSSILDYNKPPASQPSLWCGWCPNEEGTEIIWNYSEKFYNYVQWLEYIIENFLKPWNISLNGSMEWEGEERGDIGIIIVKNNKVTTKSGKIIYE
jgi:hypothetical protein